MLFPTGLLDLRRVAAPGNPASGLLRLFVKTDDQLYMKNDSGVTFPVGDPWSVVTLASEATNSTTTLADFHSSFGFTPEANKTYAVRGWFPFRTDNATIGVQFTMTNPTGMTVNTFNIIAPFSASGQTFAYGSSAAGGATPITASTAGLTTNQLCLVDAFYIAGSSPGSGLIRPQFRAEVAGTVRIYAGARMQYREI